MVKTPTLGLLRKVLRTLSVPRASLIGLLGFCDRSIDGSDDPAERLPAGRRVPFKDGINVVNGPIVLMLSTGLSLYPEQWHAGQEATLTCPRHEVVSVFCTHAY